MSRKETGESRKIAQSKAGSLEGNHRSLEHCSDNNGSLVPADMDSWARTLIAGWTEKYLDPLIETDEPELFLLFQGRQLLRFEKAFDEKICVLTSDGRLPILQPGEDYSLGYISEIAEAYDEACDEIGWEPVDRF